MTEFMDKLNEKIAAITGIDSDTVSQVSSAIPKVLTQLCLDGDSVAIPGFGTFSAVKTDEYIDVDEDGRRWLRPPHIDIAFRTSVVLRKKVR